MDGKTAWPKKARELFVSQMDSTIWNDFSYRDNDIIIATHAKAGTTWTQQIVAQLVLGGEPVDVHALSPWVDSRGMPFPERLEMLEAQQHRRFLKTHLPLDAFVFSPKARYIYIGRDGRDVVWSMHNHHLQLKDEAFERFNRDLPPGVRPFLKPDLELVPYFRRWMDEDGYPWWPFWDSVRTWWQARSLPNVLFLHFNDLKRDLRGEIARVAAFLDVTLDAAGLDRAAERCSFDYMKTHAERFAPRGGRLLAGGAGSFFQAGTNGRWRDMLTPEDIARYEALAERELGPECARWLVDGGAVAREGVLPR